MKREWYLEKIRLSDGYLTKITEHVMTKSEATELKKMVSIVPGNEAYSFKVIKGEVNDDWRQ